MEDFDGVAVEDENNWAGEVSGKDSGSQADPDQMTSTASARLHTEGLRLDRWTGLRSMTSAPNAAPPELIATDQPGRTGTDEADVHIRRHTHSEAEVVEPDRYPRRLSGCT